MNKKKFENELTIMLILYFIFYFFYLLKIWDEFEASYFGDKSFINGFCLISIEIAVFSISSMLFLIVFELFMKGISEKKENFLPVKHLIENRTYLFLNCAIFLLIFFVFFLMYVLTKNIFIKYISLYGDNKILKMFKAFLIFSVIYFILRNFFFRKQFFKINFRKYFEILGKDLGMQYDSIFFDFRISDKFIFIVIIEFFMMVFSPLFFNIKNYFFYAIFHYFFLSSIFFLYSLYYVKRKKYSSKFSLISFLPFGFIYLMFLPSRNFGSDDLVNKIVS